MADKPGDSLFADLSLHCPTCGKRADMCFSHGEEWKVRGSAVHRMTDHELRAGVNEFTEDDPPPYDAIQSSGEQSAGAADQGSWSSPDPDSETGSAGAEDALSWAETRSDWRYVLGHCPHGVDLDRDFCPKGCRV